MGSQGDHKFLGEHGASSPFEMVPGPLLNSASSLAADISVGLGAGPDTGAIFGKRLKASGAVRVQVGTCAAGGTPEDTILKLTVIPDTWAPDQFRGRTPIPRVASSERVTRGSQISGKGNA
jgi:hypothetical protein